VLRIAPVSVLTREDEDQRKLRESKEMAGPLVVKTITLSYSKARDVMSLLSSKKSQRGEITIDDRTNTLIIADVRENLDLLEKLISVLDTPTPQVSIEARIVEATSTFIRNLGISGAGAVSPTRSTGTRQTSSSPIRSWWTATKSPRASSPREPAVLSVVTASTCRRPPSTPPSVSPSPTSWTPSGWMSISRPWRRPERAGLFPVPR